MSFDRFKPGQLQVDFKTIGITGSVLMTVRLKVRPRGASRHTCRPWLATWQVGTFCQETFLDVTGVAPAIQ